MRDSYVECTTRHTHDTFQVAWAESGHGRVFCRGDSHAVAPGSLVLVPPGEMHYGHSTGATGWRYATLDLSPALLRAASEALGGPGGRVPDFDWVATTDPGLVVRFARWGLPPDHEVLEKEVLLAEAVSELLARSAAGPPLPAAGRERRAVDRSVDFLEAHFARGVPLDELARESGLSKFHLVRAFKRRIGLPPHAYQTRLRVSHAMALLRAGRSISHAAYAAGFAAQSHLHRHFKRILGVTPGEYVRRASRGPPSGART